MILAGCSCDSDSDCSRPFVCGIGGDCGTEPGRTCERHSDCAVGRCESGRCECSHEYCHDRGLICTHVSGIRTCTASFDGTAGMPCNPDVGSSGHFCDDGLICARVSGSDICVSADGSGGSPCGIDSHCDYVCNSFICSDGSAGSACSRNSHCTSGICTYRGSSSRCQ